MESSKCLHLHVCSGASENVTPISYIPCAGSEEYMKSVIFIFDRTLDSSLSAEDFDTKDKKIKYL